VLKGEKPKAWLQNVRYEVESVPPGQMTKMTEVMRARIEAEKPPVPT
jgi:hypothetical protein